MIAPSDQRLHVSWFTSATDGREHAVTDEEYAQAREARTDPEAVCGATMLPTSLTAKPGKRCLSCARYVQARQTLTADLFRDEPSRLARLLHHFQTSWRVRRGPRPAHRKRQEPNHGGLAVPPTGRAAVLHP